MIGGVVGVSHGGLRLRDVSSCRIINSLEADSRSCCPLSAVSVRSLTALLPGFRPELKKVRETGD